MVYVSAIPNLYVLLRNPSHGELLRLLGGPALANDALLYFTLNNVMGRPLLAPAALPTRHWPGTMASCVRQRRACMW